MSLSDIELIIVGQIEHGHVLAVHSLNKQPGGGKVSWKQSYWDQGNFQMNLTCTALAMTGWWSPAPFWSFSEAPWWPVGKTLTHLTWSLKRTCADNLAIFSIQIEMKSKHLRKTHISSSIPAISEQKMCLSGTSTGERKNTIKMKCHDRMLSTSTLSDQNMVRKYQFIYPKIQPNQSWKVIIFPQ